MRIIGGKLGGRRIRPPANMPVTRPTTDLAKEGLFNVLQHQFDIEGAETLDLFGGTGSISYELASRGASTCVVLEKDPSMAEYIRKTAGELNLPQIKVIQQDVFRFLRSVKQQFDFIFAGPPYSLSEIDEIPVIVADQDLLRLGGWFVLEHTPRNNYQKFRLYAAVRQYGTTVFSIFVKKSRPSESTTDLHPTTQI